MERPGSIVARLTADFLPIVRRTVHAPNLKLLNPGPSLNQTRWTGSLSRAVASTVGYGSVVQSDPVVAAVPLL